MRILLLVGLLVVWWTPSVWAQAGTLSATFTITNAVDTTDSIEIDKAPTATGPWTKYATVAANTTTFTDPSNVAGTSSCYKAEYTNAAGLGPSSNVICKTFPLQAPTQAPALSNIQ